MTRYRITGVDKDTGAERTIEVEAAFERAAVEEAGRQNIYISKVRALPERPAPKESPANKGGQRKLEIPLAKERAASKQLRQDQEYDRKVIGQYVRLDRASLRNLVACVAVGIVLGHILTGIGIMTLYSLLHTIGEVYGGVKKP